MSSYEYQVNLPSVEMYSDGYKHYGKPNNISFLFTVACDFMCF